MSVTVTHQHLRSLGYCNRGLRRWFTERGIAWADFLAHGIDADYLRATGNSMAIAAADLAEQQAQGAVGAERAVPVRKRGGCV